MNKGISNDSENDYIKQQRVLVRERLSIKTFFTDDFYQIDNLYQLNRILGYLRDEYMFSIFCPEHNRSERFLKYSKSISTRQTVLKNEEDIQNILTHYQKTIEDFLTNKDVKYKDLHNLRKYIRDYINLTKVLPSNFSKDLLLESMQRAYLLLGRINDNYCSVSLGNNLSKKNKEFWIEAKDLLESIFIY